MPRITLALEPELLDLIKLHKPKRQSLSAFCADLLEQNTLGLASPIDTGAKLPAYRVGAGTQSVLGLAVQAPSAAQDDLEAAEATQQASVAVEGLPFESELPQTLEPKKKQGLLGTKKDRVEELVDQLLITPRERGTNPRAQGTNPRATGTNPRANDTNPRALRDPFTRRKLELDLIPDDLLDCQQLLPEFWACKKGTRSQAVFSRVCNKLRQWDPDQRREALERAIASGWGDVFEPPAARASQHSLPLTPTGAPMTVGEQIAASAIAKIRALEERHAAA